MDLVSIIVPVYNVAEYLDKCLKSILNQTYENLEIILIDDGSTDHSGEICDKYQAIDSRVCVFHRQNFGVSVTRNFGIEQAKGKWILFVDSDDWIDLKTVEIAMNTLQENHDICFIGFLETMDDMIQNRSIHLDEIEPLEIMEKDFQGLQFRILNRDREAICDKNVIKLSSPCKFYKKELLDKHNIRFPENLPNGEDGVFNLYAYRYANKGVAIEKPLYYYRQRSNSVTKRYTPNVEEDFRKLHCEYKKFIEGEKNPLEFIDVMDERGIWSLGFCCILKYCHPDNIDSYKVRKQQFFEEVDYEYREYVARVKLKTFSLQKKILFWAIKKRLFGVVCILCYFNNKRN